MPSDDTPAPRRRASSAASSAANNANKPPDDSIASSRTKRRSRALPIAKATSPRIKKETIAVESPPLEIKKPADTNGSQKKAPPSAPAPATTVSRRSSRRSSLRNKTPSPKASPKVEIAEFKITQDTGLRAAWSSKKVLKVQLKLGNEIYLDSSVALPPSTIKGEQASTPVKTEPAEEKAVPPPAMYADAADDTPSVKAKGSSAGATKKEDRSPPTKRTKVDPADDDKAHEHHEEESLDASQDGSQQDESQDGVDADVDEEEEEDGNGFEEDESQEDGASQEDQKKLPRRRSNRSASIASAAESIMSSPGREENADHEGEDEDQSPNEEDDDNEDEDGNDEGEDDGEDNMDEDDEEGNNDEEGDDDDEEGSQENEDQDEGSTKSKDQSKRSSPREASKSPKSRRGSLSSLTSSRSPSSRIEKAKKKKKEAEEKANKKKRKIPRGSPSSASKKEKRARSPVPRSSPAKHQAPMNYGANATPAFYYFLSENRSKVERSLSRKHRYFNRLPKGYERNELVAKEAAAWWVKLKQSEIRRYMDLSMKDMEQRIIEWKEAKNIQSMVQDDRSTTYEDPSDELTPEDELLTYERHKKLFLGTTVGCKPFKPEGGISHNRILLELLQDMRFHPAPMIIPNRSDKEYGQMDFSRISIPYFDVHGPVSTSMGDECLGCTRGWAHFCNVLKRKIPAVEYRAKLQPPLSSLMATRVGLGLQPKPQPDAVDDPNQETVKNIELLTVHEDPEAKKARCLPCYHFEILSDPAERADDIVQFIEETVAMKVSEPPRPSNPTRADMSKKGNSRVALPLRRKSIDETDGTSVSKEGMLNKCGRCRTVIQTDTGCIQCRRAQLVINMSKKGHGGGDGDGTENEDSGALLKVSTQMLGRLTMKEGSLEGQSMGDSSIANGILRQRWTPFAILPPQPIDLPKQKPKRIRRLPVEVEDESVAESDPADASVHSDKLSVDEKSDVTDDKLDESSQEDIADGKRATRSRGNSQGADDDIQEETIDRQLLLQKMKEEADELNKKCVETACCGILLGLMRRDPLLLFAEPVTAEGYSTIIKHPIDFGVIKANVLSGKYNTLGSFVSDAKLLCTNALIYNPAGSIYSKTAKKLYSVLGEMQKRASEWINTMKDCHANAWRDGSKVKVGIDETDLYVEDVFEDLREKWPDAVEMLEDRHWLRQQLESDFMRTKENETAFYGGLAIRRAAIAADAALAPYPDQSGIFNPVGRRTHVEDESLREMISERVAEAVDPVQLKDIPMWREESIMRVLRRSQSRRLDGLIGSVNGCARCDGMRIDQDLKTAMTAETIRWGRQKKKNNEISRVVKSRRHLSTGNASQKAAEEIKKRREEASKNGYNATQVAGGAVTVKGSRIHGWGLFADQPFKTGEVVAEYIGEYVSPATTEARERMYQEQRIQDYQFRIDDHLVIDATMKGGHGRYINHSCSPNCVAKIIPGEEPNEHLKRVLIIAQRDIKAMEELSYDYQFPLELDLKARIACNCHSEQCRGFMNWDLPEKGSNSRVFRSQKRGANMRDRIRRLGRPLKGEK